MNEPQGIPGEPSHRHRLSARARQGHAVHQDAERESPGSDRKAQRLEPPRDRSGDREDKGEESAEVAIEMANLLKSLSAGG